MAQVCTGDEGIVKGTCAGGNLQKEEGRGSLDRENKKVWKNEQSE